MLLVSILMSFLVSPSLSAEAQFDLQVKKSDVKEFVQILTCSHPSQQEGGKFHRKDNLCHLLQKLGEKVSKMRIQSPVCEDMKLCTHAMNESKEKNYSDVVLGRHRVGISAMSAR